MIALGSIIWFGCGEDSVISTKKKTFTGRDLSITPANSYSDLFLDSTSLEQFVTKEKVDSATAQQLRSFYNSRNYQYGWFVSSGLTDPGLAFWNLLNSFISLSKDSSLFDKKLAGQMNQFTDGDTNYSANKKSLDQIELRLTRQFFLYAQKAYEGRVDPQDLQWFVPRKKVDAMEVLDSIVARKGVRFEEWEPANPSYVSLKKELIRMKTIANKGGWATIDMHGRKTYKPGDTGATILAVKQRLRASGEFGQSDSSAVYDSLLLQAVRSVQLRYGFKDDGIIDTPLVKALNVTIRERVEQMLINMERMRWLPEKTASTRIVANIPEFIVHVYEGDKEAFSMPIVVGKEGNSTVIFNDELKYIVFSPYWNVPASIVRKEILPAMSRNPGYLAAQDMEITSGEGGLPSIRQRPGGKNSLGRVKFLFPNNHNIYFHDTPAKSLFEKEMRAYSHGCIRLSDPVKMATYLLRDQPEWTPEKIDEAMHLSDEKWVTLKQQVPVYISYFTAWVDGQGRLNFRDDIYGHDDQMRKLMFRK